MHFWRLLGLSEKRVPENPTGVSFSWFDQLCWDAHRFPDPSWTEGGLTIGKHQTPGFVGRDLPGVWLSGHVCPKLLMVAPWSGVKFQKAAITRTFDPWWQLYFLRNASAPGDLEIWSTKLPERAEMVCGLLIRTWNQDRRGFTLVWHPDLRWAWSFRSL